MRVRRVVLGAAIAAACAFLVLLSLNVLVTRSAEGLTFDDPTAVPVRPVAIVFGAGVVNGEPTPALSDRIDGAVALYKAGRVGQLLMTGDHATSGYDEVSVMRDRAIDAGVPAGAISRDHAGLSTYDSCYRARAIFGVRGAVLVTQDYHLSRALYSCRQLGMDAVGLRIADWQHDPDRSRTSYPRDLQWSYMSREWIARAKAVFDGQVAHPSPAIGGPYLGLPVA